MKNFITIEGCEGVGKSTQLRFLREYLEKRGIPFVMTREPGGTPVAEAVRGLLLSDEMDPLTEAYLFAASRIEHIKKLILPELKKGKLVVCDRYIDSSLAYQGFARGLGAGAVLEINRFAAENCMPEATVFIDRRPRDSFRRQKGRTVEGDRIEGEALEFHEKVYDGFLATAAMFPDRFISVTPCENKDDTHARIVRALIDKGVLPC